MIETETIIEILTEKFTDFKKYYNEYQQIFGGLIRDVTELYRYKEPNDLKKDMAFFSIKGKEKKERKEKIKKDLKRITTAISRAENELKSIPNNYCLTADEKKEYLLKLANIYHIIIGYEKLKTNSDPNLKFIDEKFRSAINQIVVTIEQNIQQHHSVINQYIEQAVKQATEQLLQDEFFLILTQNRAYNADEFKEKLLELLSTQKMDSSNYQAKVDNIIRERIAIEQQEMRSLMAKQQEWCEKHILYIEQLAPEEQQQLFAKLIFFAEKSKFLTATGRLAEQKLHQDMLAILLKPKGEQVFLAKKQELLESQQQQLLILNTEKFKLISSICDKIAAKLLGEATEIEQVAGNNHLLVQIRKQLVDTLFVPQSSALVTRLLDDEYQTLKNRAIELLEKFTLVKQLEIATARTNQELTSLGYVPDQLELEKRTRQIDTILATIKKLRSIAKDSSSLIGQSQAKQEEEQALKDMLLRQVAEYTLFIPTGLTKTVPVARLSLKQMNVWFKTKMQSVKLPELPVPLKNGIEKLSHKAEQLGQVAGKPIKSVIGFIGTLISLLWVLAKPIVFLYDTFFKDNEFELSLKNSVSLVEGMIALNVAAIIMFKLVTSASLFSLLMVLFPPIGWIFAIYGTLCITALIVKFEKSLINNINDKFNKIKASIVASTSIISNIGNNIIKSFRMLPQNLYNIKNGLWIKLLSISNKIYSPTTKLRILCQDKFPLFDLDRLFKQCREQIKLTRNKREANNLLKLLFNIRNSKDLGSLLQALGEWDSFTNDQYMIQGEKYIESLVAQGVEDKLVQRLCDPADPSAMVDDGRGVADLLDGKKNEDHNREEIPIGKKEYLLALIKKTNLTKQIFECMPVTEERVTVGPEQVVGEGVAPTAAAELHAMELREPQGGDRGLFFSGTQTLDQSRRIEEGGNTSPDSSVGHGSPDSDSGSNAKHATPASRFKGAMMDKLNGIIKPSSQKRLQFGPN